jgi:subtilase family serine protease
MFMFQRSRFTLLDLVLFGLLSAWTPAVFGQAVPLILSPVDESERVTLHGNTRPDAVPANDRGAVEDSFPMKGIELLLKRSPEHEQAAAALADELERRGSRQFHKWLTADEYAERFGVHPHDVAAIAEWLRGHGFSIDNIGPNRMTILFSGTAGQVKQAFGTEIHALEVKGERHITNMSDPSVPAALAPAIQGIVSLNDFRPKPAVVPKPQYTFTIGTYGTFYAVVPADLATIYDFNPLFGAGITGQGQTIVLIEDTDLYNPNDWQTFRNAFGLDAYKGASFETVHPGFGCPDPGVNPNGDDSEAALDVEWASAAAPSAKIKLASCANTTTVFGGLIAIQNLVNQPRVPSIISMSYGLCEVENGAASNAAFKDAYQQGVLEGVSMFVSAGDEGAASCDPDSSVAVSGVAVNALASTVYNVAVGGTDFGDLYESLEGGAPQSTYWNSTNGPTFGSAKSYIPEIPWNDSCASFLIYTAEGFSTGYGANGFCASAGAAPYLTTAAGSGGPSNCATGESLLGNIPSTYTGPTPTDGTCRGWKKPAWQSVLGNPNDGVRDLPDISLFAADGVWSHFYILCNTDPETGGPCTGAPGNWSEQNFAGGTSFSSPIMAGIQALVNQVWGPQGNPAPIYYALANLEYGKAGDPGCQTFAAGGPAPNCVFHDVTIGDNDIDCTGPYNCFDPDAGEGVPGALSLSDFSYEPTYKAGAGWDFATGLGTVNATNLVLNPIWLFGTLFD